MVGERIESARKTFKGYAYFVSALMKPYPFLIFPYLVEKTKITLYNIFTNFLEGIVCVLSILRLPLMFVNIWISSITRSEEHTSELQSRGHLVCRLLLEEEIVRG